MQAVMLLLLIRVNPRSSVVVPVADETDRVFLGCWSGLVYARCDVDDADAG